MCFSRKFRLLYTISTIWFQYTHFICTVIYLYSDPYACFSLGFLLIFFQLATHVWIHPCLLAFVRQRQKSKRLPQSVLMPAWRALSLIYGRWRLLVHNVPAWRYRLIGQLSKSVVNYSCGFSYIKYILHQNKMKFLSFAIYTVFPLYMELALGLALGSVKYQTEVGCISGSGATGVVATYRPYIPRLGVWEVDARTGANSPLFVYDVTRPGLSASLSSFLMRF